MTTIGTPVRGASAASGQRLSAAGALLDQLALLPNDLALTAVGRKKAAYLADKRS